eukprot:7881101-Pyramimonas_sp.AAC.1
MPADPRLFRRETLAGQPRARYPPTTASSWTSCNRFRNGGAKPGDDEVPRGARRLRLTTGDTISGYSEAGNGMLPQWVR